MRNRPAEGGEAQARSDAKDFENRRHEKDYILAFEMKRTDR
jgi:hypothetical protein